MQVTTKSPESHEKFSTSVYRLAGMKTSLMELNLTKATLMQEGAVKGVGALVRRMGGPNPEAII